MGILFPSKQLQIMLNQFECACVRKMMGSKRRSGELWIDFEQRSLRSARLMIFQHAGERWGDEFVKAYWTYTGHRVREGVKQGSSAAGRLSWHRGLDWWRQEQERGCGSRHPRHFPKLMNEERCICDVVGTCQWRVLACNRQQWSSFLQSWLQTMRVPWASGRQSAVMNS